MHCANAIICASSSGSSVAVSALVASESATAVSAADSPTGVADADSVVVDSSEATPPEVLVASPTCRGHESERCEGEKSFGHQVILRWRPTMMGHRPWCHVGSLLVLCKAGLRSSSTTVQSRGVIMNHPSMTVQATR